MISSRNLKYKYNKDTEISFPDFECMAGNAKLILGMSGVGKTTLLHLIGGILGLQSGSIEIDGQDIGQLSKRALDQFRGKNIGIIFQQAHFIQSLNLMDNLRLTRKLSGLKSDDTLITNLLQKLNIAHKQNKRTQDMSVGERQRAAIARALCVAPKVILADEPTSALDDENCDEVIALIEQAAKEANAALLIVTHDGRLKERFPNQIVLG